MDEPEQVGLAHMCTFLRPEAVGRSVIDVASPHLHVDHSLLAAAPLGPPKELSEPRLRRRLAALLAEGLASWMLQCR